MSTLVYGVFMVKVGVQRTPIFSDSVRSPDKNAYLKKIVFLFLNRNTCKGTQKGRLIATILLSTKNMIKLVYVKKTISQFCA